MFSRKTCHIKPVIPAKAGIQVVPCPKGLNGDATHLFTCWIPACAGMTGRVFTYFFSGKTFLVFRFNGGRKAWIKAQTA